MADDAQGGGPPEKKKAKSEKWKFYQVGDEGIKRTKKSCPRCGPGIYLAEHKDRMSCGKCGYTEFQGQKPVETQEKAEQ